jgi:membrane fusion protein (multidrug efflux system)
VEIRPDAVGFIEEIGFDRGREVQATEILFRIDSKELSKQLAGVQAELAALETRLGNARRTLERIRKLREQDATTVDEVDQARTQYRTLVDRKKGLEARIGLLQQRIDDTRVRAPVSGTMSDHLVDVGDYVKRGQLLAVLVTESDLEVRFALGQQAMGKVRTGQQVDLSVDAWPERTFEARVVYVAPTVDPSTRQIQLTAVVEEDGEELKPGAFASAELTIEVRRDVPSIPEEALVASQGGYRVYVVEDSRASAVPVEIGLRKPGRVEIRSGLEIGQTVVRTGHQKLQDNQRVRIVQGPGPRAKASETSGSSPDKAAQDGPDESEGSP